MDLLNKFSQVLYRYKAARAKRAVASYLNMVKVGAGTMFPEVLGFYERVTDSFIDKTEKNPVALLRLIDAAQQAIEYYGPDIRAEYIALRTKLEEIDSLPEVTQSVGRFVEALNALKEDTR